MFNIADNRTLLDNCISQYDQYWRIYTKMYCAYLGVDLDEENGLSMGEGIYDDLAFNDADNGNYDHSYVNDRYTHHLKTNYIKKFVDEETAFSTSIPIAYKSKTGNDKVIDAVNYAMSHWSVSNDSDLCKNMLIHSASYELLFTNKDTEVCPRIIAPRHGYMYSDQDGEPIFFLHIFKSGFDIARYIDIYTDSEIIHCTENFQEVPGEPRQVHLFGRVPVSECCNSGDGWLNSIYNNIIGLQNSLQKNGNAIAEEVTEFRNAYMEFINCRLDPKDLTEMKKKGIINVVSSGTAPASVSWVTKNINDAFLTNNLAWTENKIYELGNHINNNKTTGSNVSSIAMKAKLISVLQKCKQNNHSIEDCIRNRLKLVLAYSNKMNNTNYDYKDVEIIFTMNVPSDDLQNANIINLLGDKIPADIALSLMSFIQNPQLAVQQAKEQNAANSIGNGLLNPSVDNTAVKIATDSSMMAKDSAMSSKEIAIATK